MELPQPPRPLGNEGRKPTHDFLSLYTHSTAQQDPSHSFRGGYIKTHDFLRPLERIGKTCAKQETTVNVSTAERPAPPPLAAPTDNPSVERVLPGGIGTYSISHISCFNQRAPKPEGSSVVSVAQASNTDKSDDGSRCSSLSGSGFTLWEESAVKKGKTRNENLGEKHGLREPPAKIEQWTVSRERPSQSSSSNHRNSFSSLCSPQSSGQRNRSFDEMLKSAVKVFSEEEELDDAKAFVVKKESSPSTAYEGELRINVGGKGSDQKANTPRSKHSATEQRRRSKINDRFLRLRELIPRSDQKRDKASFLLEVIEYIQFLQEKVRKYEGSHQGWFPEPAKLIPTRNNCNPAQCYIDQSQVAKSSPVFIFAAKSDEKNKPHSSVYPRCSLYPIESETSTATTFRETDHHPATTNNATPYSTSQQCHFIPTIIGEGAKTKSECQLAYRSDNKPCEAHLSLCEMRSCSAAVGNKLKKPEQSTDGGRISISSAYSQGLLKILTQALQSSGVDMAQANISVQIELGKRTNYRETVPTPAVVDDSVRPSDGRIIEDLEQGLRKKQKS